MTWPGRSPLPGGIRVLGVGGAIGISVAAAALIRPEMSLLLVIALPVALITTSSRAAQVTLYGTQLTVSRGRRRWQIDLGSGPRAVLCRWVGPAAVSRGLALRVQADRGASLIIGSAGAREDALVAGRVLEARARVDVVLPPRHLGELARAVVPVAADDAAVAAALVPQDRGVVFELWKNPHSPHAFLFVAVAIVLFAVLARFALGMDDWMTRGGGSVPYIAAALLAASVMYDAFIQWGRRSAAMTLAVAGDELIVRHKGRPTPIARAPLHSVRTTRATWERQQADMPEFNWRRLPSLKVTVDATCELTVGAGVEPWDRRLLPTPAHPSAAWPADVPRARPPKYLALAEDWTALVEILASASGSPELVRQGSNEGVGPRRVD